MAYYYTKNILLTGFWPPTNEMLRLFSPYNPGYLGGWWGRNWRNRGFDVYAFFPEFDKPAKDVGWGDVGTGDFPVDYQGARASFEKFTAMLHPCAIITFSRGDPGRFWEIESRQRNLRYWIDDSRPPFQPTPSPPDSTAPPNYVRESTLPMEAIRDRVLAGTDLHAYIDTGDFGGGFLSEFIAYLGVWYQARHAEGAPLCVAAGHVHVSGDIDVPTARLATEITLETVLDHVRRRLPTIWVSRIRLQVATADRPYAGTESAIHVDVLRDGAPLQTLRLDPPEPGGVGSYEFEVGALYPEPAPAPPWIPLPLPAAGIQLSRGVHSHLGFRLRTRSTDRWTLDWIQAFIKEWVMDTLQWTESTTWQPIGRWPQNAHLSLDPREGVPLWLLNT